MQEAEAEHRGEGRRGRCTSRYKKCDVHFCVLFGPHVMLISGISLGPRLAQILPLTLPVNVGSDKNGQGLTVSTKSNKKVDYSSKKKKKKKKKLWRGFAN